MRLIIIKRGRKGLGEIYVPGGGRERVEGREKWGEGERWKRELEDMMMKMKQEPRGEGYKKELREGEGI